MQVDRLRPVGLAHTESSQRTFRAAVEASVAAYFELARKAGWRDPRPTSAVPTPAPRQDRSFREVNI